jgi:hypothetical protein
LFSFVHFWNRPWFLSIRVALERIHRYIRVFYIRVTLDRIHPGYFGPDTSGFYIRVLHPDYFQRDRSPRAAFCLYFSCLLSAWIFIYLPIIPTPRLKQHGYHHIRIGYDLHPSSFILHPILNITRLFQISLLLLFYYCFQLYVSSDGIFDSSICTVDCLRSFVGLLSQLPQSCLLMHNTFTHQHIAQCTVFEDHSTHMGW